MTSNPLRHVVAVVPVRGLEGAKSRLGGSLDAEERRDLVTALLRRTLEATSRTAGIAATIVVSPDPEVLALAGALGAKVLGQQSQGLNQALDEARLAARGLGASALLVLPGDLPRIDAAALDSLIAEASRWARGAGDVPIVVIVPDRHGRGTNALLIAPPDAVDFAFGGDSRQAHAARAIAIGARLLELGGPLGLDLDTPDDLLLAEADLPERARAG
jgi:2-phospho-L-lactate guanylyltransferase